ncbi:Uu.00g027570.m01.CDS01 [Anthostomella pinea]|uniref:Uu.00g027570.m01.CDS01 n=1 Tax=Anthostomella pinea TaxID=933095 RepID=A0AAI8YAA8_9PEZI|nr:Uu.00g027570.m01.CDS01 [Anthostomella pinea]
MAPKRAGRMSIFRKGTAELFSKKWPRLFFLTAALQAIICMVFEAYTFAKFQYGLYDMDQPQFRDNSDIQSQLKTIPTFLGLFILGFIYVVVMVWDALLMKNTIQVIGLCIANLALLVYGGLQIDQIHSAVVFLVDNSAFKDKYIWNEVQGLLIAIPCIIALTTLVLGALSWKLYQEFAWDILKHIGADYRMKKRFLHYQVYIALLKFDFFFFIGFTIQFLVVVGGKSPVEFGLTAAAIPVTIAILLCAAWFTRREWKSGMIVVMILYLGGLTYFIFKLVRIYEPGEASYYMPVRKSLTAFAVLTIILIIMTIINAMVCMFNFGHGLKQHLLSGPRPELDKDQASYSMHDVKQSQLPSRMTID